MINESLNLNVHDRKTFIEFLKQMRKVFLANDEAWENQNLDDFLEAMAACAEDVQGFYDNTGQKINADEPSWKLFADILKGATMYE